jgi:predicted dehydrogenase
MILEPIRFGVLGASSIAQDKVLPALAKANGTVAWKLGSRDPAGRKGLARAAGVVAGTATLAEVVADPMVDAVYVSLPNSLHQHWVLESLAHGKPVLCDKPLVPTPDQASAIAHAAGQAGLAVMEGFMYRFHPQHARLRQLIASEELGQVREFQAHFLYRMAKAVTRNDIRLTDGAGAGALLDMGCYTVSAARSALGAEPVSAEGFRRVDPDLGIDTGGVACLTFAGGQTANLSWGYDTGYGAGIRVVGTAATVELSNPFVPGQGTPGQASITLVDSHNDRQTTIFEPFDQFQAEFEAFAAAVRNGKEPPWGVDDAVRQANAMALLQSLPVRPTWPGWDK